MADSLALVVWAA